MKNRVGVMMIVAALFCLAVPRAQANPNWLTKHLPHHQASTPLHPEHDPQKSLKQHAKDKQRSEKMRGRAADRHALQGS
jgi:hypothetical protein